METLDKIQRRLKTTEDLESIARTMKALAAVNIRQYERAAEALADYSRNIEVGFQIALQKSPSLIAFATKAPRRRTAAIVFGSDQGMCGPLNNRVVDHTLEILHRMKIANPDRVFLAIGSRVASRLTDAGHPPTAEVRLPASVPAITTQVQEILFAIDELLERGQVDQLILFYPHHLSRSSYRPDAEHLLPIDEHWLHELSQKEYLGHSLPLFTMDVDALFSALIRQYLFTGIYRALAETLASENASRLATMRRAEKNINDRLAELKMQFHQQRQSTVTSELLDIISAFETLDKS